MSGAKHKVWALLYQEMILKYKNCNFLAKETAVQNVFTTRVNPKLVLSKSAQLQPLWSYIVFLPARSRFLLATLIATECLLLVALKVLKQREPS